MSRNIIDVMRDDFGILEIQPRASLRTTSSVAATISGSNTWQKLDLSTGSPDIECQGGFIWDTTDERIVWDSTDSINMLLTSNFIGDAQVQITSVVSTNIVIQLGLVLNADANPPNVTPPIIITPITFTSQSKITGFGANSNFSKYTSPSPGDTRLDPGDNFEIWIRCLTDTPSFQIDGMNVQFKGR